MTTARRSSALLVAIATGGLVAGVAVTAAPTPVASPDPPGAAIAPAAQSLGLPSLAPVAATLVPVPVVDAPLATASPRPTATPTAAQTQVPAATSTVAPTPTPKPKPTSRSEGTSAEAAVVALTNEARADAGCAALRPEPHLARAAQGHSDDMAAHDYFEHDSRDGGDFAERIRAAGYADPGGENIARGQRTAAEVVQAWLDSPGHRRNIEDCSFTRIGVGHSAAGDYWTQDFGR